MKNNIILFDIDYTLFNTELYRHIVFAKLSAFFPDVANLPEIAMKAYEDMRMSGWFDSARFTKELLAHVSTTADMKTLQDVWNDASLLEKAVYPEAKEVLKALSAKNITLGIFSSGYVDFQLSKITNLAHLFTREHIHIHVLKDEKLPDIARMYKSDTVVLVDDFIPVLEKTKQADPAITTIWIKRGKLAEKVAPSDTNPPDFVIEDLTQLMPIVDQVLA